MRPMTVEEDLAPYDPWGVLPLRLRINDSFEEFVRLNPDLTVEQNSNGEIVIRSPTGGESSRRNAEITFQLRAWSEQFEGVTFDSSVIFCLPDGSKRSPDASWISSERWLALSQDDRKKYPPITPEFVIELRSESDRLQDLEAKMGCYRDSGVRLEWLIDPLLCHVHVYEPGKPVEILAAPEMISNEQILPKVQTRLKANLEEIGRRSFFSPKTATLTVAEFARTSSATRILANPTTQN